MWASRWLSGKESACVQKTRAGNAVWILGLEDPLEEEITTHSSILAWEIPWTRSLAGYSPWAHERVRPDLVTEQHLWPVIKFGIMLIYCVQAAFVPP